MRQHNHQIIKLKDYANFEENSLFLIRAQIESSELKNDALDENKLIWKFDVIIGFIAQKYKDYVINVNTTDELEKWNAEFTVRFVDRLPILYGQQKIYMNKAVQQIDADILINTSVSEMTTGVNSSDYAMNTPRDKFGNLSSNDAKSGARNLYANMSAMLKFSLDTSIEKWCNEFDDLFIFYYE